jgi:hypothetical protein
MSAPPSRRFSPRTDPENISIRRLTHEKSKKESEKNVMAFAGLQELIDVTSDNTECYTIRQGSSENTRFGDSQTGMERRGSRHADGRVIGKLRYTPGAGRLNRLNARHAHGVRWCAVASLLLPSDLAMSCSGRPPCSLGFDVLPGYPRYCGEYGWVEYGWVEYGWVEYGCGV